jgi:hypothetical protein
MLHIAVAFIYIYKVAYSNAPCSGIALGKGKAH